MKTGFRTFFEVLGIYDASEDGRFRREGAFVSYIFLL